MNTKTTISASRRARQYRYSPINNLIPSALARKIEAFEAGHLREAAIVWEAIEQRDELLRGVISKRKKAVARHGWAVLPVGAPHPDQRGEVEAHAAALDYFYRRLECEHAVDQDERGGFKLLARQMMDAVGKRFAVHEIVWKPAVETDGTNRGFVTAKFRFVPLAYFENTTGQLRFLEGDSALRGVALEPGAWMITVGEGLMIASSAAWTFKNVAMDDWMRCSQRNGTPGLSASTSAAYGSPEWNAFYRAIEEVLEGRSVVHSTGDKIEVLDLMGRGNLPFPGLVERIDRMLAALWRGADLSTLSRDRGYGASLQEKETCLLEEDDADMLTETLNFYVDRWVIRHVFGPDVEPLARVKVLVSPRECTGDDLRVDEFLLRHGAPLSLRETLSRYGRTLPRNGEPILRRGNGQASLPENSQPAEDSPLENETESGPVVSFRGCSPAAEESALANQFTVLQEEWVQLSPYGDFPHARGLQRVDRGAAERIVAQFNSFRGRLGRLFGGLPFYVGHPDLPGASELADRKAYGWIIELEAREDGLFGRVKWSESGALLLRNAHYKYLSPYWEARETGSENGRKVFQPVALLSAGFTNQPNIPVKPLANEAAPAIDPPSGAALAAMHTASCTANLGIRRGELARARDRRDRIQECVRAKMKLGLAYDEAWESAKREQGWFDEL